MVDALTDPDLEIIRSEIKVLEMPIITSVINKSDVLFQGQEPMAMRGRVNTTYSL